MTIETFSLIKALLQQTCPKQLKTAFKSFMLAAMMFHMQQEEAIW